MRSLGITEPVTGNMNCILPEPGYLEGMRELCTEYGAILIFDEVMTGFRFGTHCAQGHLGIDPDLTCLGKSSAVVCQLVLLVAKKTSWHTYRPWTGLSSRHAVG